MSRTLIVACEDGNINEVNDMIANGANIDMTNNDGKTPLSIASQNGHLEIVEVLIASGGLVNKADNEGETPLHIASQNGDLEIVKALIANKANFLYKNNDGETPLDVAIAKTNEIKQYIMNHPWYRRRSLLVTRPHADHETNKEHQLSPLGEIITATPGSASDPSGQDNVLFQIKIKIASFL